MFNNYLKIAFRNLLRYKTFSLINISGLAIGIAGILLIGLYVQDELSYDKFHKKANRIYRLTISRDGADASGFVGSMAPIASTLKNKFPELEDYVRFDPFLFKKKHLLSYNNINFYEERFVLADPSIFKVFDFKLLQGDPETVLTNPNDLVITKSKAEKYFGNESPIGKSVVYDGKRNFTINGVMEDIPQNSHYKFDFVASFKHINAIKQWKNTDLLNSWGHGNFYTYVLLKENVSPQEFEIKSSAFLREITKNPNGKVFLQPITKIHLFSQNIKDPEPHGNIMNIYLYSAIAVVILLIACINFMNLYTANSEVRAKEVGMRKVLGAKKNQLILQLLGESIVHTVIALPLSILLLKITLPLFNAIIEKNISLENSEKLLLFGGLILMTLFVGLFSGIYPAFSVSSFQPIKMLRGKLSAGKKGFTFRNILVVFQFAISILFITGSMIINDQMQFIRDMELGYDRANIVNIPVYSPKTKDNYNLFRNEIMKHNNIVDATATSFTPSIERWRQGEYFEGRKETDDLSFYRMSCDFNYFDLFGMDMAAGRSFNRNFPADLKNSWILNESAIREIGWNNDEAIGKSFGQAPGRVVGVVKDFHFRSLRFETKSMAINIIPGSFQYISIKIHPNEINKTVQFIKNKWNEINAGYPFEYFFYDDEFDKLYKSDLNLQATFQFFTFLAIFIACLGLFGLSLFTVQRRTKEIGIRKVLGANFFHTTKTLTKEFMRLIFISYIIASPIAYLIMTQWLENFSYRTHFGIDTFLFSGLLVFFIALLTVSYKVIRVSKTNPAEVLKYE